MLFTPEFSLSIEREFFLAELQEEISIDIYTMSIYLPISIYRLDIAIDRYIELVCISICLYLPTYLRYIHIYTQMDIYCIQRYIYAIHCGGNKASERTAAPVLDLDPINESVRADLEAPWSPTYRARALAATKMYPGSSSCGTWLPADPRET